LIQELTYLAWGDSAGGLGVIRFSENPSHTRVLSLAQTIEDTKLPERKFVFTDLTNQLVDGVFARHLPNIHPLEVKQVLSTERLSIKGSVTILQGWANIVYRGPHLKLQCYRGPHIISRLLQLQFTTYDNIN